MVLNDKWIKEHSWMFNPYDESMVNPASIDLRWSGRVRNSLGSWRDPSVKTWEKSNELWSEVRELDTYAIFPFDLVLLDTLETVQIPPDICGIIMLKSSIGRFGLEHLHAGFFDPGFGYQNPSTATLEIFNSSPRNIAIRKGQPIIQMVFMTINEAPEKDYRQTGKYNGQLVPQEAK